MRKEKLVVIGNGMAGIRCVEEILKIDANRFEVSVIGHENHLNYNRILLSSVLQGDTSIEKITISPLEWYEKQRINLYRQETALQIDTVRKQIVTDKQRTLPYDQVIIATGSSPFILPVPGIEKQGIMTFRTLDDCHEIMDRSRKPKKVVVIGGGVLGLEIAVGLRRFHEEVKVVHKSKNVMDRQLDHTASSILQKELEKQGIQFLLGKETKSFVGEEYVEGIEFLDGSRVEADLVVMAVGIRPNIDIAKTSGIQTNQAIVVNDFLETNIPGVYAVGECAEHNGVVYGLVQPLYEQGKILAKHICHQPVEAYNGSFLSTKLKIPGIDVFSAGLIGENQYTKAIMMRDETDKIYKKMFFRYNKLVGVVLVGETSEQTKLLNLIVQKKDLSDSEKIKLLEASNSSGRSVAVLSPNSLVCNCNSVTKKAIIEAVQVASCTTTEQVVAKTKAASSCGGCRSLVEELVYYINSEDFQEVVLEVEALCACTSLSEEQIIEKIHTHNLQSFPDIIDQLDWSTTEGCTTCRPALHYFLEMIYPEYKHIGDELHLHEKKNAILMKDGTYTIIPQMYGGITNSQQLQSISNVINKYKIPRVQLTNNRRIQLSGIEKEKLLSIWEDLNMPLSSRRNIYIQSLDVLDGGNCHCNQEESEQISLRLEKKMTSLKTPAHIIIQVAPCVHQKSVPSKADIFLIKIERGWEIRIGEKEILAVMASEEDLLRMIYSFIQYYRETAKYQESISQWTERVGMIRTREVLFDPELVRFLIDRFEKDVLRQTMTHTDETLESIFH